MKKVKLIPPDKNQCQAERPNGYTFMTFGGTPAMIRCANVPTVIAKENDPGKDGQRGSMSLCDDCLNVYRRHFHESYSTITMINRKVKS